MERALGLLMMWLERLLAVVLIASIALNFGNVIARYVFGTAMLSADELQVYGLVAITFLGAAVVTWRRQHLRMDILRPMMSGRVGLAVRVFEATVAIVVISFVCLQSWRYVAKVWSFEQVSDMAHIPMWIPHSFVLIGFLLIAAALVATTLEVADPEPGESRPAEDATS